MFLKKSRRIAFKVLKIFLSPMKNSFGNGSTPHPEGLKILTSYWEIFSQNYENRKNFPRIIRSYIIKICAVSVGRLFYCERKFTSNKSRKMRKRYTLHIHTLCVCMEIGQIIFSHCLDENVVLENYIYARKIR